MPTRSAPRSVASRRACGREPRRVRHRREGSFSAAILGPDTDPIYIWPPGQSHCPIHGHKRTFPFTMVGRDGARSEKPRRSRASLPDHPSRVMRIGGACCVRGTAPGAIPLAVWRPGGAWGGFASLRSFRLALLVARAGPLLSRGTVPRMTLDGERGGAMVTARREAMR